MGTEEFCNVYLHCWLALYSVEEKIILGFCSNRSRIAKCARGYHYYQQFWFIAFFFFFRSLWISHSKMKEKISRLPQMTVFLCRSPLSFSFMLCTYKNVTAACRFIFRVRCVHWILYLNWNGIDHCLFSPWARSKAGGRALQQSSALVCVWQTWGWLFACSENSGFSVQLFSFAKGHGANTGWFFYVIYTTVSW